MAKLTRIYYGNPILRKRTALITEITPEIRQLAADMISMFGPWSAAGLAAPQVGYSIRLFVLAPFIGEEKGHYKYGTPRVYINPVLSEPSKITDIHSEGCISIPGIWPMVERPYEITIEGIDLDGKPFRERASGYYARQLQHECDHLDGILMTDPSRVRFKKPQEKQWLKQDLLTIEKKFRS